MRKNLYILGIVCGAFLIGFACGMLATSAEIVSTLERNAKIVALLSLATLPLACSLIAFALIVVRSHHAEPQADAGDWYELEQPQTAQAQRYM